VTVHNIIITIIIIIINIGCMKQGEKEEAYYKRKLHIII
jgi:hypothetical protein